MTDNIPLTGFAALSAALQAANPLPAAHSEISRLVEAQVRPGADGAVTIYEADGKSPMFDPANGYANASPEAFVARLQHDRPELFGSAAKQAPKASPAPVSITEAMIRAKRGDGSALAALNGPARVSLTEQMVKAKHGDATAIQYLFENAR